MDFGWQFGVNNVGSGTVTNAALLSDVGHGKAMHVLGVGQVSGGSLYLPSVCSESKTSPKI